ncbi:MAG TPA: hypothetical protein H9857_00570 [Candidatus Desulfovibrio intestinigallinarum]|nr:hypothetical protein [Candidatus Desulfovibrio intestinigallinarum]
MGISEVVLLLERFSFEKGERQTAAQRRPAQSERKNRVFSAKRQAVWFETHSVSN